MENLDSAWFEDENTFVEILSYGGSYCKVRWVVEPGIEVTDFVLYEDLKFEEEETDGV